MPLVFEPDMDDLFDVTIAVSGDEDSLAAPISGWDGDPVEDACSRMDLQMSRAEKSRRADYTLSNAETLSQLAESVDKLLAEIEKEFLTISEFYLINQTLI